MPVLLDGGALGLLLSKQLTSTCRNQILQFKGTGRGGEGLLTSMISRGPGATSRC